MPVIISGSGPVKRGDFWTSRTKLNASIQASTFRTKSQLLCLLKMFETGIHHHSLVDLFCLKASFLVRRLSDLIRLSALCCSYHSWSSVRLCFLAQKLLKPTSLDFLPLSPPPPPQLMVPDISFGSTGGGSDSHQEGDI